MKKTLFTILALGSAACVSADQYNQQNGSYNSSCRNGHYGDQSNQSNFYQRRDANDYLQNQRNDQFNQGNQYGQQMSYGSDAQDQMDHAQDVNTDQEIRDKIHDELSSGWFSKGFQNVSYDVHNGNVNLRGTIDTIDNKNKVEDEIRRIKGVRQINNQIRIGKGTVNTYSESQLQDSEKKYTRDTASSMEDREINAKIRNKVSNGWFTRGYETIILNTTNGKVSVTGNVDKLSDVQTIVEDIKGIDGVRAIDNHITVTNR